MRPIVGRISNSWGTSMRSWKVLLSSRGLALLALLASAACGYDAAGPYQRPGDPQSVDIAFCSAPDWVAFQDGDGAWEHEVGTRSGPFLIVHHTFLHDRAAIAVVREFSSTTSALLVDYGAPDELKIVSDTAGVSCGATTFKTVHGTVAGLAANELARVSLGSQAAVAHAGTGFEFEVSGLVPGPNDLIALRRTQENNESRVTAMIIRRGVDLPDGAAAPVLDFGSNEAFVPVAHTLTVGGPDAGGATTTVGLRTAHGTSPLLTIFAATPTATTAPYIAVPEARLEAGDLQSITITSAATSTGVRSAELFFRSPVDRTVTLGPASSAPGLSVISSTPSLRMRARFDAQSAYDRLTVIGYQQGEGTLASVGMTAEYAARSATGYDLVLPDFSVVEGFDPRWALRPGELLRWTSVRFGGSLAPGFNAVPTAGTVRQTATFGGQFAP
jgi:hypothetical protein